MVVLVPYWMPDVSTSKSSLSVRVMGNKTTQRTKSQVANLANTVSWIAWKGEHSKHVDTCPSTQEAKESSSIKKLLSIRYTFGNAIKNLSSPLPYPSQQVPTY